MKLFIKLVLTTLLLSAIFDCAEAQVDTLSNLPMFQNAVSEGGGKGGADVGQQSDGVSNPVETGLQTLQSLYFAGKYRDVLSQSQKIHDSLHLSKDENLLRLKYTIASFREMEYDREADSLAKIFLQKDPFYSVSNTDLVPFREVLDNYYTKPQFSVWVAAGQAFAGTYMDTICSIVDTIFNSRTPDYSMNGFVMQVGFEYRPFKLFSISFSPSFTTYSISRSIKRSNMATFYYEESSHVLTLPLYVESGLYLGREIFVPSIYAGAQMKYIINSQYTAFTEIASVYTDIPEYKDNTDLKNRLNYSFLGGIRLNFNHRRMTYFADLGVSLDMLTYNNPEKKYSNYDLLYQHFHVPDIFQMFEYAVKIGVKVNLKYKTIAKYNYGY